MCSGMPSDIWEQLKLGNPDEFHYLSEGCTQFFGSKEGDRNIEARRKSSQHRKKGIINDSIVDDINDFKATEKALSNFGVTNSEKMDIYRIVAAVLHLGNVSFEESPEARGGCHVKSGSSEAALQTAGKLIGIDPDELRQCLLSRIMTTNKGNFKSSEHFSTNLKLIIKFNIC